MVWQRPCDSSKDRDLFSVKVKVRDEAENDSQIKFTQADSPLVELADENMNVIHGAALAASPLNIKTTPALLPSETLVSVIRYIQTRQTIF